MAVNLVVHPVVGIIAVSLILAAFTAKARRTKLFRVHYALALSAYAFAWIAFFLGLSAWVAAIAEDVEFEETVTFHFFAAVLLVTAMTLQVRSGLRMWRGRRHGDYLEHHRAVGRTVALLAVIIAALGAVTFALL